MTKDPNVIIGAQPALFLSRTRGNVTWFSEETDAIVGTHIVGVVTFRQVKVVISNRDRKIAGSLGKPVLLN